MVVECGNEKHLGIRNAEIERKVGNCGIGAVEWFVNYSREHRQQLDAASR